MCTKIYYAVAFFNLPSLSFLPSLITGLKECMKFPSVSYTRRPQRVSGQSIQMGHVIGQKITFFWSKFKFFGVIKHMGNSYVFMTVNNVLSSFMSLSLSFLPYVTFGAIGFFFCEIFHDKSEKLSTVC